jgi:hypothetical protein
MDGVSEGVHCKEATKNLFPETTQLHLERFHYTDALGTRN